MPELGWDAVTVPGAVDVWASLSRRFGKLPFADFLNRPSVTLPTASSSPPSPLQSGPPLRSCTPISPILPRPFSPVAAPRLRESISGPGDWPAPFKYCRDRRRILLPREIAEKIVSKAAETGGAMTREDLAGHHSEWVKTLSQDWQGVTLHELPPNGQGLTVLIALGILEHLAIDQYPVDSADSLHLQIEAMKMAFAIAGPHIADPAWMTLRPAALLDRSFLKSRRAHPDGPCAIPCRLRFLRTAERST